MRSTPTVKLAALTLGVITAAVGASFRFAHAGPGDGFRSDPFLPSVTEQALLRGERWNEIAERHWDHPEMLTRAAFLIGFDYEKKVADRDFGVGERFARRAVELTVGVDADLL